MAVPFFKSTSGGGDESDGFANKQGLWIDFFHVLSGKNVYFKSFVENISDSDTSRWNQTEVFGRMDPISTFQGTIRDISFDLVIPAYSYEEAQINLRKVGTLASFLYPSYEVAGNATTINAAPLIKIKFLNLIMDVGGNVNTEQTPMGDNTGGEIGRGATAEEAGLLGTLSGLSINHDFQYGAFINNNVGAFTKLISINFDFQVLHQHPMGWDGENQELFAKNFPYGQPTWDGAPVLESGEEQAQSTIPDNPNEAQERALKSAGSGITGGAAGAGFFAGSAAGATEFD